MLNGCRPWPKKLADEYIAKGYWENVTFGDILDRSTWYFPNREALVGISPVSGEVRDTYLDLQKKANRLAFHLLRLGLKPHDRVILQLPNIRVHAENLAIIPLKAGKFDMVDNLLSLDSANLLPAAVELIARRGANQPVNTAIDNIPFPLP